MTVAISLLFTSLLGGEPAPASSASQLAEPKVYMVYVTVVEVDADGHETILFTPKLQTTGKPAGVAVGHADGRSFEFHCSLSAETLSLERLPAAGKQDKSSSVPPALTPAGGFRIDIEPKNSETPTNAVVVRRAPDEFYVRNYEVSDLIETSNAVSDADFAPLIQTLKTIAEPVSWSGKATIRPFTSTKSLVIRQNDAGHRAIAKALEDLRPQANEQ